MEGSSLARMRGPTDGRANERLAATTAARTGECEMDRIVELRRLFEEHRDPIHAEFHKGYHKSELAFYGLKTPVMRSLVKRVFPVRAELTVPDMKRIVAALWVGEYHEEKCAALELLPRIARDLPVSNLALLKRMSTECLGWGLLDSLACHVIGPFCDEHGAEAYDSVRKWADHRHMWTRRASVICHILPSRAKRLHHETAWGSWESLLPESEFFIRKAIGWALREASKHYPAQVHGFLIRVGDRASGLTRREGGRNLPPKLRRDVLGK